LIFSCLVSLGPWRPDLFYAQDRDTLRASIYSVTVIMTMANTLLRGRRVPVRQAACRPVRRQTGD
jgi:hypothetical protein